MEVKGYFSKICLCKLVLMSTLVFGKSPSSLPLLSLMLWLWEGAPSSKRNSCPAFRKIRGGQRTLPALVDCQLPSAQNNLYAIVTYLGQYILIAFSFKQYEWDLIECTFVIFSCSENEEPFCFWGTLLCVSQCFPLTEA